MINTSRSRQPIRPAWTTERLLRERSTAIGSSLDPTSVSTYNSHAQSYLAFCNLHNFSTVPTEDTLSFYVVYMCHYIKPQSVESYLSGICNTLEPYYPNVRTIRRSQIVTRTLAGCKKMRGTAATRKRPLNDDDLRLLIGQYDNDQSSYDDRLFLAIISTGYHALMRLGELAWPDNPELQSWRKVTLRLSVKTSNSHFSFTLPYHKADRFFEGNVIFVEKRTGNVDPLNIFTSYLAARDSAFGRKPALWIKADGNIPTYSWVRRRLSQHFENDVAGHSLRSGGATRLAELGVPDSRIQNIGRWASEAFRIYIRKNPVLLQALVQQHNTTTQPAMHHH